MFTVVFGFSVANAKTVGLTLDLDYNDADVFNIFYEFKNNTAIAQLITKYSFDILNLFAEYNENFSGSSNSYSSSFNYDYLSNRPTFYNVFIFKQQDQYKFVLAGIDPSYFDVCYLLFDKNAQLVKSEIGSSKNVLGIDRRMDLFNIDNVNSKYPYRLFSLYQGDFPIYSKVSYSLNYVKNDGQTYKLDGVDLGVFGSISKFFTDWFKDDYSFGENWSFNFDYYNNHLVSSPNTRLKSLKETFFQLADYDMSDYSMVYINQNEKGVFFIPKSNKEDFDNSFYIYATHLNTPLYGNALYLGETVREDVTYNDVKAEGNTFGFNLTNPCVVNELPVTSFNFDSGGTFGDYVYHLFTTKFTEDIIIYYDSSVYDIFVPNESNSVFNFNQVGTGKPYTIDSTTVTVSRDNVNNTTGGHLNEDMSGKPGNGSNSGSAVNDSNVNNLLNNFNPKDIIGNLNGIFSTMVTFISDFLDTFPDGIKMSIYFFFIMALCIAIVKLLV